MGSPKRTRNENGELFCIGCEEWLHEDHFQRHRHRSTGRRARCRPCGQAQQAQYAVRKRVARAKPEPESIDPMDWIRELARLKQQQPHSFF